MKYISIGFSFFTISVIGAMHKVPLKKLQEEYAVCVQQHAKAVAGYGKALHNYALFGSGKSECDQRGEIGRAMLLKEFNAHSCKDYPQ